MTETLAPNQARESGPVGPRGTQGPPQTIAINRDSMTLALDLTQARAVYAALFDAYEIQHRVREAARERLADWPACPHTQQSIIGEATDQMRVLWDVRRNVAAFAGYDPEPKFDKADAARCTGEPNE